MQLTLKREQKILFIDLIKQVFQDFSPNYSSLKLDQKQEFLNQVKLFTQEKNLDQQYSELFFEKLGLLYESLNQNMEQYNF